MVVNDGNPLPNSLPEKMLGNVGASDAFTAVYDELKNLARHRLASERADHTLQPTALVHEAYVRLGRGQVFVNRAHFFHAAAEAMRRILIEHARSRKRLKRGGDARRELVNVLELAAGDDSEQILSFDEAIGRLEVEAPQAASVVRLRFYAGLSVDETAEALSISARTVNREWTFARAWLFRVLECEYPK